MKVTLVLGPDEAAVWKSYHEKSDEWHAGNYSGGCCHRINKTHP